MQEKGGGKGTVEHWTVDDDHVWCHWKIGMKREGGESIISL